MIRRGITIAELLVTIGVIGLVLAIALPVFTFARHGARQSVTLSNLRQHAAVFASYSGDHDGLNPRFVSGHGPATAFDFRGLTVPIKYFEQHRYWNFALVDAYYGGGPPNAEHFAPPGYPAGIAGADGWTATPYFYSCTFVARPEYWSPFTRTGVDQWAATRLSEVRFPSSKAMIISSYPHVLERPDPKPPEAAFADGSVSILLVGGGTSGAYDSGDGYQWFIQGAYHLTPSLPGMHTIGGVHGRDR
jgi:type II secretory pathway pseudopilin PulG